MPTTKLNKPCRTFEGVKKEVERIFLMERMEFKDHVGMVFCCVYKNSINVEECVKLYKRIGVKRLIFSERFFRFSVKKNLRGNQLKQL